DDNALSGIAVVSVDRDYGDWQYTLDGGQSWQEMYSPGPWAARLLAADGQTRVRFMPNLYYSGQLQPALSFRAWDQTVGVNGGTLDAAIGGGETPFSS